MRINGRCERFEVRCDGFEDVGRREKSDMRWIGFDDEWWCERFERFERFDVRWDGFGNERGCKRVDRGWSGQRKERLGCRQTIDGALKALLQAGDHSERDSEGNLYSSVGRFGDLAHLVFEVAIV